MYSSDDANVVRELVNELVFLTAVGEQTRRPSQVPLWLLHNDLFWWAVEAGWDAHVVESALTEEPEILTATDLCQFVFGGRMLPRKRGYVGT